MAKDIGSSEYWDEYFRGEGTEGKVKQSDGTLKPAVNPFDRIGKMLSYFDGTEKILDVGSATANFAKRWTGEHKVVCSDHSQEAKKQSGYEPYFVTKSSKLPFAPKEFDYVMCTQSMEYMDDNDEFLKEASRVARKALISVPLGKMALWSQKRVYSRDSVEELLSKYGEVEFIEVYEDLKLIIAKVNFD